MESPRIRVLVTAFAAVPGSSPHGPALLAMTAAVRGDLDLVTIKTESLSHVERIGDARMFRVPVGEAGPLEQRVIFERAVARQIEAERYDVVHVRGPFEGAIAADRKSAFGFQLVYEMATFPDEALGIEVEKRWAEAHQKCLEHSDLVLVPTEAARRAVTEIVPPERVVVLPPGVDVGTFDWRPLPSSAIPRLLYLGQFTADRDLATVLGAIRRVLQVREVRVLMAGETDRQRRERLRAMVDAFELRRFVDVRGEPPSRTLPQVIAGSHLCLAPASEAPRFQSLGDLPQPLLEYMACHRPVVAAGVPGVSDVLRDEQEGLLYLPGDERALTEAILVMLADAELRDRTTENAYRRVRELFSSGARRRRIAEIYERLAPGSQNADPWDEAFADETGEVQFPASISDVVEPASGDTILPETPDDGAAPLLEDTHDHFEPPADLGQPPASERLDSNFEPFEMEPDEAMAAKTHPGLSVGTPARVDDESDLLVDEPTQESAPDTDPGRTGRKPDTDPGRSVHE